MPSRKKFPGDKKVWHDIPCSNDLKTHFSEILKETAKIFILGNSFSHVFLSKIY